MALSFRTGPNSWTDPAFAARMGMREWKGPEPASAASVRAARPAVARRAPAIRAALPPPPPVLISAVHMTGAERHAERNRLRAWLAEAATKALTEAERAVVAEQQGRLRDLARFG